MFRRFCCSQGDSWKQLNEFTIRAGLDLVFGLNLVYPRNGESWDPTNAKQLLDFNTDLGYKVIWELGNGELNVHNHQ